MMSNFIVGFFVGCFTGLVILTVLLIIGGQYPAQLKREAYDRGYMVECLGVEGYHWDCEVDDS